MISVKNTQENGEPPGYLLFGTNVCLSFEVEMEYRVCSFARHCADSIFGLAFDPIVATAS